MRVLVTTTGSAGHLGPLIPFADAIRDAGGRGADAMLGDGRYARQDALVAAEIRTLPTVDVAAGIIRELAVRA